MEFVLFLNVHSYVMYEVMFGDKDTFELAFMLAGKAGSFQKMPSWARNALSEKTKVSCPVSLLPSEWSCRHSPSQAVHTMLLRKFPHFGFPFGGT